mmetsp:Transcript_45908/g.67348  ORF Transcript_45908/g.67348 Transcript_45908/m.67348 type:complete len:120 (-) Transcript_45908:394-753(-)
MQGCIVDTQGSFAERFPRKRRVLLRNMQGSVWRRASPVAEKATSVAEDIGPVLCGSCLSTSSNGGHTRTHCCLRPPSTHPTAPHFPELALLPIVVVVHVGGVVVCGVEEAHLALQVIWL